MSVDGSKPVILLTFANDRLDGVSYLRNLPEEARRLRTALEPAECAGLCELVVRQNATAADVLDTLQDARVPRPRRHLSLRRSRRRLPAAARVGRRASIAAADAVGLAAFLGRHAGCGSSSSMVAPPGRRSAGCWRPAWRGSLPPRRRSTMRWRSSSRRGSTGHSAPARLSGVRSTRPPRRWRSAVARRHATSVGDEPGEPERLPWHLQIGEGAELAADWSLPEAAGDPLFGLPPLPQRDLPENPYLEPLAWYTREHAEVFFGRGYQIREMFERVVDPGRPAHRVALRAVGHRQVVAARRGVAAPARAPLATRPRYLRRDQQKGLLATLREALAPAGGGVGPRRCLAGGGGGARPAARRGPRPGRGVPDAHRHRSPRRARGVDRGASRDAFVRPDDRPRGKLVLGFRMEWLAVIERRLVGGPAAPGQDVPGAAGPPRDHRGGAGTRAADASPGREVARPVISRSARGPVRARDCRRPAGADRRRPAERPRFARGPDASDPAERDVGEGPRGRRGPAAIRSRPLRRPAAQGHPAGRLSRTPTGRTCAPGGPTRSKRAWSSTCWNFIPRRSARRRSATADELELGLRTHRPRSVGPAGAVQAISTC